MTEGFFKQEKIDLTTIPGKKELLKEKKPGKQYTCADCKRCSFGNKEANTPIPMYGLGKKNILIITDAADQDHITNNKSIVGQQRHILEKGLKAIGIDLYNDCITINSVRGYDESGTDNNAQARKACRPVIHKFISSTKPKVIVPIGFSALSTLIGHKESVKDDWDKLTGYVIPDNEFNAWVLPTWGTKDFFWLLNSRLKKVQTWANKSLKEKGYISKHHQETLNSKEPLIYREGLHSDEFRVKWNRFVKELREINNCLTKEVPIDTSPEEVEILKDPGKILNVINYFLEQRMVALDIEANSLKSYRKEADIICIGLSDTKRTVSYMTNKPDIIDATKELIRSNKVKKVAFNNPYEWGMFKGVWDVEMNNIIYDAMLMVHVYDHRTGVCSLKLQSYLHIGIKGFEEKTKPFFKRIAQCDKGTKYDDDKNTQRLNGLQDALDRSYLHEQGLLFPLDTNDFTKEDRKAVKEENKRRNKVYNQGWVTEDELLLYVGLDPLYTAKLVNIYSAKMSKQELAATRFLTEGALALSKMTFNGIYVNKELLNKSIKDLSMQIAEVEEQIKTCDEVKAWDGDKEFNPGSPAQLGRLLFTIHKHKVISKTKTDNPQVNKSVLEKLNTPLCKLLLKRAQLAKVKSTYLEGYIREMDDDGFVHPEFLLFSTTSFRSSACNPNTQNSPKRNKKMKKLSRMFIDPYPGHTLIEYDYSGAETFTSACVTGCPTMKKYMIDPTTCMHGDTASFLFMLDKHNLPTYKKDIDGEEVEVPPPEDLFDTIRQLTKTFVFGQFYGDFYKNQVVTLWEDLGQLEDDIKEWIGLHMVAKGIGSPALFTERLKQSQDDIWNRFKVYDEWKNITWKSYVQNGYIDTVTGTRLRGVLNKKQTSNLPIQGPSFHHLLHGIILASKEFERLELKSKYINQVHDSFLVSVAPGEEEIVDKVVTECFLIKAEELPELSWAKVVPFVMDKDTYEAGWASNKVSTRLDRNAYTKNYVTA